MKRPILKKILGALLLTTLLGALPASVQGSDFVVYSVYRALDLGNPGEVPAKDFYVNMGSAQGVRVGTTLEVARRVSTYDLMTEKLYRDVTFPIAQIKVIHVESNAAIARLEKLMPVEKTPAVSPRGVMVGDLVRVAP